MYFLCMRSLVFGVSISAAYSELWKGHLTDRSQQIKFYKRSLKIVKIFTRHLDFTEISEAEVFKSLHIRFKVTKVDSDYGREREVLSPN